MSGLVGGVGALRRSGPAPGTGRRRWRVVTGLALVAAAMAVVVALAPRSGRGPHPGATAPAPTTTALPAPVWVSRTVDIDYAGVARSYLVVRPAVPKAGLLPVVVMLHGHSVTPEQEQARGNLKAVTGPAILVYPAGIGQSWNAGHCCQPAQQAGIDDVGFVRAVLDRVLATERGADASRAYLAGYSNGAKLALTVACQDPAPWQAVAVYGATAAEACPNPPAVSLMVAASTGDPELTIGPSGPPQSVDGFVEPTVVGQVAAARLAARCTPGATTINTGTLSRTTWACPRGRRVQLALYSGGNHGWPAGDASTPSGAQAMWSFLSDEGQ